jgi:hypothetical protein
MWIRDLATFSCKPGSARREQRQPSRMRGAARAQGRRHAASAAPLACRPAAAVARRPSNPSPRPRGRNTRHATQAGNDRVSEVSSPAQKGRRGGRPVEWLGRSRAASIRTARPVGCRGRPPPLVGQVEQLGRQ